MTSKCDCGHTAKEHEHYSRSTHCSPMDGELCPCVYFTAVLLARWRRLVNIFRGRPEYGND